VWKYHKPTVISYARALPSPQVGFQRDKSNDLIQPGFNFPLQAYGVRMADKSLIVLKRRSRGGRTAP
jgi:hypothetical protein